jgi:periplasmic protein TonB
MMRLWVQSYAKTTPVGSSATLSLVAHVIIIGAWVYSTLPESHMPNDSISNRVVYIPPPDKVPGPPSRHERVQYVDLDRPGFGLANGDGPRMMGEARPTAPDESASKAPKDSAVAPPVTPPSPTGGLEDSVFTVLDVDTAVVRSSNSAAPAYPLKLLQARIMGSVSAQYIVDTTGFADTASFTVMKSTHPEFVLAVREALPYMRFKPAKIGPLKVRQLVEQQFSFRITDTATVAPPGKKPE